MLYITIDNRQSGIGKKAIETNQWHVGQASPIASVSLPRVLDIQADGDELAYIMNRFKNIPVSPGRVVCWFGDHAKFIVANLT